MYPDVVLVFTLSKNVWTTFYQLTTNKKKKIKEKKKTQIIKKQTLGEIETVDAQEKSKETIFLPGDCS